MMETTLANHPEIDHQSRNRDFDHEIKLYCFTEWMSLQEHALTELQSSQALPDNSQPTENLYTQLTQRNIQYFENYIRERSYLARLDPLPFIAPTWCNSLENSLLWIGGCRSTMFFRLVYSLSGLDVNSRLNCQFSPYEVAGPSASSSRNHLGELSVQQLEAIRVLQVKTLKEEERITGRLAILQDNIAGQSIVLITQRVESGNRGNALERGAEPALKTHEMALAEILEVADGLRLNTLKELTGILTAEQAVDFLAAGKRLQLCMHAWGKSRDQRHGRNTNY